MRARAPAALAEAVGAVTALRRGTRGHRSCIGVCRTVDTGSRPVGISAALYEVRLLRLYGYRGAGGRRGGDRLAARASREGCRTKQPSEH